MKRKMLICVLLATCMIFTGILVPTSVMAKKPVILKLVIATPAGDWPQTYRDMEMAKRFNKRANGEYRIEVHPGGALAKLPEFFDAVRVGVVEMQFSNWGMFSFMDPRLGVLELPFLSDSNEATAHAAKELLPVFDSLLMEKFNAKGLGMMSTGGLGLWTRNPITRIDDISGMLVASVSPHTSVMLEGLGASPVMIPFPDIYESLQKKVVDGASMSAHGGNVFQYFNACKNFTAFYGMQAFAGYTINLDVWKKMPSHIQALLIEETGKSADWMTEVVLNELPDKDIQTFQEKNVNIKYLSEADRAKLAAKFQAQNSEQLAKFGELGQQVKEIVERMNKKYPYTADKHNM